MNILRRALILFILFKQVSYAQDSIYNRYWAIEPSFAIAASSHIFFESPKPNIFSPTTLPNISLGISVLKNLHPKHTVGIYLGYRPLSLQAELNTQNVALDSGFQSAENANPFYSSNINHLLSIRFLYRYRFFSTTRIDLDIGGYFQPDILLTSKSSEGLNFGIGDSTPIPPENILASMETIENTILPVIPVVGFVFGFSIKNKRVPLQSWRFSWESQFSLSRIWRARVSEPGTLQNYDQSFDVFEWWNGLRIAYSWGIKTKHKR